MYESYARDRLQEVLMALGLNDSDIAEDFIKEVSQLVVEAMMDSELYESFEELSAAALGDEIDSGYQTDEFDT
jgi:hypothetical protein